MPDVLGQHPFHAVARAVVDDNQLEVSIALRQHAFHGPAQQGGVIVDRQHHADQSRDLADSIEIARHRAGMGRLAAHRRHGPRNTVLAAPSAIAGRPSPPRPSGAPTAKPIAARSASPAGPPPRGRCPAAPAAGETPATAPPAPKPASRLSCPVGTGIPPATPMPRSIAARGRPIERTATRFRRGARRTAGSNFPPFRAVRFAFGNAPAPIAGSGVRRQRSKITHRPSRLWPGLRQTLRGLPA